MGDGGNRDADIDKEETPRGPLSPFPRRRRRRTPGLLLPYLSSDLTGSNRRSCRQHKINMLIKNTLHLFVSVLTSATQC